MMRVASNCGIRTWYQDYRSCAGKGMRASKNVACKHAERAACMLLLALAAWQVRAQGAGLHRNRMYRFSSTLLSPSFHTTVLKLMNCFRCSNKNAHITCSLAIQQVCNPAGNMRAWNLFLVALCAASAVSTCGSLTHCSTSARHHEGLELVSSCVVCSFRRLHLWIDHTLQHTSKFESTSRPTVFSQA